MGQELKPAGMCKAASLGFDRAITREEEGLWRDAERRGYKKENHQGVRDN